MGYLHSHPSRAPGASPSCRALGLRRAPPLSMADGQVLRRSRLGRLHPTARAKGARLHFMGLTGSQTSPWLVDPLNSAVLAEIVASSISSLVERSLP